MNTSFNGFLLISCCVAYLTTSCNADVGQRFNNNNNNNNNRAVLLRLRSQRLESAYQTPYPSVGFRPERPFNLPPSATAGGAEAADQQNLLTNEFSQFDGNNFNFPPNNNNNDNNFNNAPAQPDVLYGAPAAEPARLRQFQSARLQQQQHHTQQQQPQQQLQQQRQLLQQQQQFQPQQQFPTTRLQLTPARLTDEREERELVQDNPSDIELDVRNAAENIPATPTAAAPPTIAYYPAGAFGFVKPLNAVASPATVSAPIPAPVPAGAYVQYQSNGLVSPLAKFIAAPSAAQLPIAATSPYYATSLAPQSLAFTAYSPYAAAPAQLQAW